MDFNKYAENFEKELYGACLKDLEVLKLNESNDLIFSYAIYLPSGFETFSSASCNHEGITEALAEMSDIKDSASQIIKVETCVDYWNIYEPGNSFEEVNNISNQIFDELYDIEDPEIYSKAQDDMIVFFSNCIVNTLLSLKKGNHFSYPPFEKDILTGLQYNTPTDIALEIMLNISEKVNSPEWHKKMLEAYSS